MRQGQCTPACGAGAGVPDAASSRWTSRRPTWTTRTARAWRRRCGRSWTRAPARPTSSSSSSRTTSGARPGGHALPGGRARGPPGPALGLGRTRRPVPRRSAGVPGPGGQELRSARHKQRRVALVREFMAFPAFMPHLEHTLEVGQYVLRDVGEPRAPMRYGRWGGPVLLHQA